MSCSLSRCVLSAFLLFSVLVALPADAITRDAAISIVETTIIDTSTVKTILDGFALQDPLAPGAVITEDLGDTVAVVADSAWFFWLDNRPIGEFEHPTEYILVNFATGAIDLCVAGKWWPGVDSLLYYVDSGDRETSPDRFWTAGASIPKQKRGTGRSLGIVPKTDVFETKYNPWPTEWDKGAAGPWGIIVCPYDTASNETFRENLKRAKEVFDSLGVSNPKIVHKKSAAQTLTDIEGLPNGCDKLYVYWTGHGDVDELSFPGPNDMSAKDFACKLAEQGAKEYCVMLQFCHSGSILDELTDKGVSGFHVTSTSDSTSSTGMKGSPFTGSIFSKYFFDCILSGLRGVEAYEWARGQTRDLIDSLLSSPDSLTHKPSWSGKYKDDDHPQGGYTHRFGSGSAGAGESFCFELAASCSTGCIMIPGSTSSDTCANFTLACEATAGTGTKWTKVGGYNWNKGKTIYFRTFGAPGATGKYKMTMHSNKGGSRVGITWLPGTSTPVTPVNSDIYNTHALGWTDGTSDEFDPGLGAGTNGFYQYGWFDGTDYNSIPGTTGPNWFNSTEAQIPLLPDFDRLWIYNGGDPQLGYQDNTVLVLAPVQLVDPFGLPTDPGSTFVQWQMQQPIAGYFAADAFVLYSDGSTGPGTTPKNVSTLKTAMGLDLILIDLGTIFPEPAVVNIGVFGPGAIEWDAMMLVTGDLFASATNVDEPVPAVPRTALHPNEPNPFNPVTRIRFELDRPGRVRVEVYDISGRLVRTLLDAHRDEGLHDVTWDGRADDGSRVGSGMYFTRMEDASGARTNKMVLVR